MKLTKASKILLISILISAVLIVIGVVSADTGVIGNMIIISTFVIAGPLFFLRYKRFKEIKEMEEKFPVFLRDLIEAIRAGMPLHRAILSTNKTRYGALSKEIKKISDQISWGITVDKTLEQFAERVRSSKRLYLATKIIRESELSGGNVVSTLDSVVDSQIALVDAEKEKASMLSQYVLLMYAISIIFVIIVVGINKLMVPIFKVSEQTGGEFGIANPCETGVGLGRSVCGLFSATASGLFSMDPEGIAAYYTSIFFFMSMVQSVFSGLVAGQISEGSAVAGFKHSLILAGIVFGMFSIMVRLGLFGA